MTGQDLSAPQPSQPPVGATFNQHGANGVQIAHANTVNAPIIVVPPTQTRTVARSHAGGLQQLSTDAYHLFVTYQEEGIENGVLHMEPERAHTEYTNPELKARFASLDATAIKTLKTYPAVFTTESRDYGHTDEDHMACWGLVTDIQVQDGGIRIAFQKICDFPLQRLNENTQAFGLSSRSRFNELNRTHWALKRVNLLQAFIDVGIPYNPYEFISGVN